MKEQLITFDTAKLAKEKGFNYPTLYSYGAEEELSDMDGEYFEERNFNLLKESEYWNVSAPTQSLLQKWLREEHEIDITVMIVVASSYGITIHKNRTVVTKRQREKWYKTPYDNSQYIVVEPTYQNSKTGVYEEALEKGLQESLKLIK